MVGRGSSGVDELQSMRLGELRGVVSSSSAAGREEGAGGGRELGPAAFSVVLGAFPTLACLGGLGTGVADSSNKPNWIAWERM
jgi:hypothetical protein